MKTIKLLTLLTLILGMHSQAFSQCKGFTKRNCLSDLSPYISNGQLIAAKMVKGQEAEIELNFQKNIDYRLIICAEDFLEGLSYRLIDEDDNVFTAKTLKGVSSTIDFEVSENSELKLQITIPEKESNTGIIRNGCVSILIGFRE